MHRPTVLIAAVAVAAVVASAFAGDPESDYRQLQKWRFSSSPIALTQPVTITRDTATWTLQSGSVRLMEPLSSGRCTGLVFEGNARFVMTIPDRIERAQLRRFTGRREESIDTSFSQLVLRVSDDTIDKRFTARPPFTSNSLAQNRHNHWLIDLRTDVDAAILAAAVNSGALAMTAGIKTDTFDWLTWDYDSTRMEEIQLVRWTRRYPETWISLHRSDDRGEDARPARLDHIDVRADLTRYSFLGGRAGETGQRKIDGRYTVEETITPLTGGLTAVRFQLDPTAREVTAKDANGAPLVVIRDHIGARSAALSNKLYDPLISVFFPTPLPAAHPQRITFAYQLESENFALGRSWYPTFPEAFDPHTARLELLVNKRNEIRAMGRRESESETPNGKLSIWSVTKPAMMITFSTAEHFEEATINLPDVPQIISFGTVAHLNPGTRVRNAGVDVANSVLFFQTFLDAKLDTDRLYVTSITGDHGQAFDGFLHLAEWSYASYPGLSELFRAHETAHEWFGHMVGWKSYRDQWLTESFAEYVAMIYIQSTAKDGTRLFDEILESYESVMLGNMGGGFSKFNPVWLVRELRNSRFRARLGPIGIGYRAGTGELPMGYMVQSYYKGPLVLHMLRSLLRYRSESDDLFRQVLRDFVHEYRGKRASTEDFRRILERDAPDDWGWFFDAWIYGAEIPTLTWSYKVDPAESGYRISVTVKRSGVSDDFSIIAPVRVELDGDHYAMVFVPVKKAEQTVTQILPVRPRNVIFAPNHSLLANVRRE